MKDLKQHVYFRVASEHLVAGQNLEDYYSCRPDIDFLSVQQVVKENFRRSVPKSHYFFGLGKHRVLLLPGQSKVTDLEAELVYSRFEHALLGC